MEIRAVLFDLDGTLVDSLPGIEFSVDCAFAECQMPPRERELRSLIGPPIRTIFSQLLSHADEQQLTKLESAFRVSYDSIGWRKTVLHDNAGGALGAVRDAGLPLFLVTNKPQAATHRILGAFDIDHLFTAVLCRDSRTPSFQSKAEMLGELVAAHSLEPATCMYIGDSREDYQAGKEAGIPTAIVAHGYGALE